MIVSELRFLLFFALAFAVHWALRGFTARKLWLLACSWGFYCAWDWRFLGLILVSTAVDWVAGGRLAASDVERTRRLWLQLSLAVNLGLLGVFKYLGWFVDSGVALCSWLGIPASERTLSIVLPVGISFYTFQTLSYTIDVYRRRLAPARSALDLALFVAFFPQLVAGPIVRASEFLPQLARPVRFARIDVKACLVLFLTGWIKKDVVSDTVAEWVVDPVFAAPQAFDAFANLLAILFELVVLYCDFSGYSDMAIATAGLLGYQLAVNFDFPWFARNTVDFWRRWHISLTTWMRDYVYRPLGGDGGSGATGNLEGDDAAAASANTTKSSLLLIRNVMLTMLAIGLWHGAAWTFVAFGALHGIGILLYRAWRRTSLARAIPENRLSVAAACLLNVAFHAAVMPFFRASSVEDALGMLTRIATWDATGSQRLPAVWLSLWLALALAHAFVFLDFLPRWWRRIPDWLFASGYGTAFALALACGAPLAAPFVYFQF